MYVKQSNNQPKIWRGFQGVFLLVEVHNKKLLGTMAKV